MPTFISHGVVAIAAGKLYSKNEAIIFWLLSIVCSILPDADALSFIIGIRYGSTFGHRGFSHSILFATLIALIIVSFGFREIKLNSKRWWALLIYFSSIGILHGILDAMTNGGLGVGFFIPFESSRYFLPFRPIEVSPLGLNGLITAQGVKVMISEALWIWFPAAVIISIIRLARSIKAGKSKIQIDLI